MFLLNMELRCDAMLCSNLGSEGSDAGHIKCSRGPQVLLLKRIETNIVKSAVTFKNTWN